MIQDVLLSERQRFHYRARLCDVSSVKEKNGPPAVVARVPPVGELRNASSVGFGAVIGTPDDLVAKIEQMEGYATHLALGLALPGIEPKKIRSSMKLVAEKVMPHFKRRARKRMAG